MGESGDTLTDRVGNRLKTRRGASSTIARFGWPILSANSRVYVKHAHREPWTLGSDMTPGTAVCADAGLSEQMIYVTVEPMRTAGERCPHQSDFDGGWGYGVYSAGRRRQCPSAIWIMLRETLRDGWRLVMQRLKACRHREAGSALLRPMSSWKPAWKSAC